MINQATQVVFIGGWTNYSLCCEDLKRILQDKQTLIIGLLLGSKTVSLLLMYLLHVITSFKAITPNS